MACIAAADLDNSTSGATGCASNCSYGMDCDDMIYYEYFNSCQQAEENGCDCTGCTLCEDSYAGSTNECSHYYNSWQPMERCGTCHSSCAACGFNSSPIRRGTGADCITCADGSAVTSLYDDATGCCGADCAANLGMSSIADPATPACLLDCWIVSFLFGIYDEMCSFYGCAEDCSDEERTRVQDLYGCNS
ncbi:hypothetical protein CYMTET_21499, partial [Cymbomonas tetramitiformis]